MFHFISLTCANNLYAYYYNLMQNLSPVSLADTDDEDRTLTEICFIYLRDIYKDAPNKSFILKCM